MTLMAPRVTRLLVFHLCLTISIAYLRSSATCCPLLRQTSFLTTTTSTDQVLTEYDANAITVLEGLEPVRKRPGMYIGSTGIKGLHHLVFEVVDNSVDEALAGHCRNIIVSLHKDGSVEVQDDGRGIPCSIHPTTGKSALETVLCVLHAGGKFGGDESGYKVSGGLHGVGISVVNALSEKLTVEVVRDGKHHQMSFAQGKPTTKLLIRNTNAKDMERGTKVIFRPDPMIFKTTVDFEFDRLAGRLDELAYLNAGLNITLFDRRSRQMRESQSVDRTEDEMAVPKKRASVVKQVDEDAEDISPRVENFYHEGGVKELIQKMCSDKTTLHPEIDVMYIKEEKKGVTVELAMRWSKDQYTDSLIGFANGIRTSDGGSHLDGMKAAVTRTINAIARKLGKLKDAQANVPGEFIREGLTAVVSVKVPEPEFEGQTKTRLGNPEVRQLVDTLVSDGLGTMLEWNPNVLGSILTKALDAQAAAVAAKAARDMVRRKSLLSSTVLPGKLADCASRVAAESEIYIVEGDSAAGSAKQGRDRRTQAILPLRGKILNIEKASNEKIYQNSELQNVISALGLGIRGTEFDAESLRYHKIIIMTDADVDGAHIRILLLTFFYRYQRELIQNGFVYVACPPLYKVSNKGKNSKDVYLYDQKAMDAYLATLPKDSKPTFQRFKGLGEMMPDQLWETTMDPSRRTLKRVSIEDAAQADRLFSVLMGDNVNPRKEFITLNAAKLKVEDLDFY